MLVILASGTVNAQTTDQILIEPTGTVTLNREKVKGALKVRSDGETVLVPWVTTAKPVSGTVSALIRVNFKPTESVNVRIIPSRCACQTTIEPIDAQTYRATVTGVLPGAQVTVSADFPPGSFQLDPGTRFAVLIERASPVFLGIALLILLASLGLLGWMAYELYTIRQFRAEVKLIDRPPNELSPVMISLIPSGKITSATLAAMLLDLARRGYLAIVNRNQSFAFTETRPLDLTGPGFAYGSVPTEITPPEEIVKARAEGVTIAEKFLLSKLFTTQAQTVTDEELQARLGHRLSSWKIGKVYAELYKEATEAGYFIRNPHEVHLKYRGIGMLIFFIGLLGAVGSYFLPGEKTMLVLVLMIVALAGYVITRMVPYLPLVTVTGQAEWIRWAGFRAYLVQKTPLDPAVPPGQFFEYLPYALAFNVLDEWSNRFSQRVVIAPSWYITEPKQNPVPVMAKEVGELTEHVAKLLAAIHEHTMQ